MPFSKHDAMVCRKAACPSASVYVKNRKKVVNTAPGVVYSLLAGLAETAYLLMHDAADLGGAAALLARLL